MDRRRIEEITSSLAVILLFLITFGGIFFAADQFFNWDLFSPQIEKVLGFIFVSCLLIIVSSVLVNMMINLSIIAITFQKLTKARKSSSNES